MKKIIFFKEIINFKFFLYLFVLLNHQKLRIKKREIENIQKEWAVGPVVAKKRIIQKERITNTKIKLNRTSES